MVPIAIQDEPEEHEDVPTINDVKSYVVLIRIIHRILFSLILIRIFKYQNK